MMNKFKQYVSWFLIRRKPSANSRPYFLLLLLLLLTTQFLFPFLCHLHFPRSFFFLFYVICTSPEFILMHICHNLPKLAQTCPNLPKLAKTWLGSARLSFALVISPSQCTGACWEFVLEPLELPFILSGVCSPSEANYCSNPFEVFTLVLIIPSAA